MTDAVNMTTETSTTLSFGARLGQELREAVGAIKRIPERIMNAHSVYSAERDFDRIHNALSKLNKRQLAMLGLKRQDIYTFTELCVFNPERRPELRLYDGGPTLMLAAPSQAGVAQIEDENGADELVTMNEIKEGAVRIEENVEDNAATAATETETETEVEERIEERVAA
ncbi:MAG: hypothetical protein AAF565_13145 [Pseudomonadota bacterium]